VKCRDNMNRVKKLYDNRGVIELDISEDILRMYGTKENVVGFGLKQMTTAVSLLHGKV